VSLEHLLSRHPAAEPNQPRVYHHLKESRVLTYFFWRYFIGVRTVEYEPFIKSRMSAATRPSNYSGVTLNVARPDMNNYATLGVVLYWGIGGSKDFALWDLARRATLRFVLY
jgi:hypothetical protein